MEEWKKGNRKRWHGSGGMEEGERKRGERRQRRQETKEEGKMEEWKKENRKRWHGAGGMEDGGRGKRKYGEDGGKNF
jgi:hypothetical protein